MSHSFEKSSLSQRFKAKVITVETLLKVFVHTLHM